MKFKTKGLIIKQQNIGERDRLVWVLTESHGILRAFARGAKNIKSPKCAGTGLLSYAALTIFEGRDSYSIDEAEALEQFIGLRSDIENMSLAQYFCELCLNLCPTGQEAKEQLRLALNSIYLLANKKRPPLQIKICFEMRLITLCGYMPDLVMCDICGVSAARRRYGFGASSSDSSKLPVHARSLCRIEGRRREHRRRGRRTPCGKRRF